MFLGIYPCAEYIPPFPPKKMAELCPPPPATQQSFPFPGQRPYVSLWSAFATVPTSRLLP